MMATSAVYDRHQVARCLLLPHCVVAIWLTAIACRRLTQTPDVACVVEQEAKLQQRHTAEGNQTTLRYKVYPRCINSTTTTATTTTTENNIPMFSKDYCCYSQHEAHLQKTVRQSSSEGRLVSENGGKRRRKIKKTQTSSVAADEKQQWLQEQWVVSEWNVKILISFGFLFACTAEHGSARLHTAVQCLVVLLVVACEAGSSSSTLAGGSSAPAGSSSSTLAGGSSAPAGSSSSTSGSRTHQPTRLSRIPSFFTAASSSDGGSGFAASLGNASFLADRQSSHHYHRHLSYSVQFVGLPYSSQEWRRRTAAATRVAVVSRDTPSSPRLSFSTATHFLQTHTRASLRCSTFSPTASYVVPNLKLLNSDSPQNPSASVATELQKQANTGEEDPESDSDRTGNTDTRGGEARERLRLPRLRLQRRSSETESDTAGATKCHLEANPYYDIENNIPINTVKHKQPLLGQVKRVVPLVQYEADPLPSICHVELDLKGKLKYWEGQSIGVMPPGINPQTGKPNRVRLYSIASTRYGDDGEGQTVSLCVRRAIFRSPETGVEQPTKQGLCSNILCTAEEGSSVHVVGPSGKTMVLPESNPEADVIMVATGTGIAPYRFCVSGVNVNTVEAQDGDPGLAALS